MKSVAHTWIQRLRTPTYMQAPNGVTRHMQSAEGEGRFGANRCSNRPLATFFQLLQLDAAWLRLYIMQAGAAGGERKRGEERDRERKREREREEERMTETDRQK